MPTALRINATKMITTSRREPLEGEGATAGGIAYGPDGPVGGVV